MAVNAKSMEEPGQLIRSNLQLTSDLRQLEQQIAQLKTAPKALKRTKFFLETTSDLLPAGLLHGGIGFVPENLPCNRSYRLPKIEEVAIPSLIGRSMEFDIRNDSGHNITITTDEKGITLDSNNVIASHGGSRWYLEVTKNDKGKIGYEVVRLS